MSLLTFRIKAYSRDQFSKATRRWGFQKQPRGSSSIHLSLNEVAGQRTTSDATRNESLSTTNLDDDGDQQPAVPNESSNRPRSAASSSNCKSYAMTHDSSSSFVFPLVKGTKPKDEPALTVEHIEMCRRSNSEEDLYWPFWPEDELVFTREREAVPYFPGSRYTASVDSSDFPSYSRTPPSADHITLHPLSGNPTMCRSLASHSSRASQVSVSSSFKRFKASALNRRIPSESMAGLSLCAPARQLGGHSLQELQDLEVRHVTMGLSTLVEDELSILEEREDKSYEGELGEDEKP